MDRIKLPRLVQFNKASQIRNLFTFERQKVRHDDLLKSLLILKETHLDTKLTIQR